MTQDDMWQPRCEAHGSVLKGCERRWSARGLASVLVVLASLIGFVGLNQCSCGKSEENGDGSATEAPETVSIDSSMEDSLGLQREADFVEHSRTAEANKLFLEILEEDNQEERAQLLDSLAKLGQYDGVNNFETALSHYSDADYTGAITLFRNIVRDNPENVGARFYLGMAKWRKRESSGATLEFQQALKLDPCDQAVRVALYFILRQYGHRRIADSALESRPKDCPSDSAWKVLCIGVVNKGEEVF